MDVGCIHVILITKSEPQQAEMLIYIYIYSHDYQLNLLAWLFSIHFHILLAQAPDTMLDYFSFFGGEGMVIIRRVCVMISVLGM